MSRLRLFLFGLIHFVGFLSDSLVISFPLFVFFPSFSSARHRRTLGISRATPAQQQQQQIVPKQKLQFAVQPSHQPSFFFSIKNGGHAAAPATQSYWPLRKRGWRPRNKKKNPINNVDSHRGRNPIGHFVSLEPPFLFR